MKVITHLLLIITIINIQNIYICNGNYVNISDCSDTVINNRSKRSENFDQNNDGIWSKLLEDYTINKIYRTPRIMQTSHRYIPTSGFYITKRIGEAMELEPHMRRPPGKVITAQNQLQQHQQQQQQQQQTLHNSNRQYYGTQHQQPLKEVTETDLYLLSAIEKLVYRVDYLENRLRRTEQMIYYLMAGNNQKEIVEPCPINFTRIGDNCYHIAGDIKINWKSANNACKMINSNLAEFENLTEMEEIMAYILNHPNHRGKDFWLGGLNPGLLWIWSNSAKPVNPNTNLTSYTTTSKKNNSNNNNNNNKEDENDKNEFRNSTVAETVIKQINIDDDDNDNKMKINKKYDNKDDNKNIKEENRILNNSVEIKGNGRCLRLSYNPTKHSYHYYGQECTSRHHYLCEYQDKTLDNKILKIAKDLNL